MGYCFSPLDKYYYSTKCPKSQHYFAIIFYRFSICAPGQFVKFLTNCVKKLLETLQYLNYIVPVGFCQEDCENICNYFRKDSTAKFLYSTRCFCWLVIFLSFVLSTSILYHRRYGLSIPFLKIIKNFLVSIC